MKNCKIVLLFTVILSLISCSGSNVTVLLDSWWEDAYDYNGDLEKILFKESVTHITNIPKIIIEDQGTIDDILYSLGENKNRQTVIISPIFYSHIKKISSDEKKINYILLNGFYGDDADNIIAVYSSRGEVYYQAGVKAALFSKNNDNCTVAAVFYNGSSIRKNEKKQFIDGYESVIDSGELIYYDQQNYTGGEKLKNFINSAPEKGAGLFFFSASSINPFCLDLALPLSIPVSGENLNSLGFYNELVEFSVDDDIIEIIETAVKMGLDGEIISDIPVKARISEKGIHF